MKGAWTRKLALGRRATRGASAVEFALVLPLLMLLLLGSIDWGYYFFLTQVATNAAREGARAGSLQYADDGLAITDATAAAEAYLGFAGLATGTGSAVASLQGNGIRVTVTCTAGSVTGFSGTLIPTNVLAVAEMRRR